MTNAIMARFDEILDETFDSKLEELLAAEKANFAAGGASAQTGGTVKQYQTVGPAAREKLKGILKHYAKDPTPFRTCVKDQVKHGLSQEMADKRCAVIKDIIRNGTGWRGNPSKDHGAPGVAGLSETTSVQLDEETADLVDRLSELDLWALLNLVELDESPSSAERDLFTKKHGKNSGVSLKKDHKGFYVHTHRARSKSYASPDAIPAKDVAFIESTG